MVSVIALSASVLPGLPEMVIIVVIGLLLFGRDLPTVGKAVGKTMVQLRQSFQKFKDEMASDVDLRDVGDTVRGMGNEVRGFRDDVKSSVGDALDVPEEITNPRKLFEDLTDGLQSSEAPMDDRADAADDPLMNPGKPPAEEDTTVTEMPEPERSPFLKAARNRADD